MVSFNYRLSTTELGIPTTCQNSEKWEISLDMATLWSAVIDRVNDIYIVV